MVRRAESRFLFQSVMGYKDCVQYGSAGSFAGNMDGFIDFGRIV